MYSKNKGYMAQQLTLSVENANVMASLRKVLSLMEGVTIVKTPRISAKKKLTPYEQSMDDLRNGNVSEYECAEDFYKEMGMSYLA